MNEFKHILHASLLLLASIVILICLRTVLISTQYGQVSRLVVMDNVESIPKTSAKGRQLFIANCASCHIVNRNSTGPSLCGFEDRGPWGQRENAYQWIRNSQEFMKKNDYVKELRESFSGAMMTSFPNLTNVEIDEIINYINGACISPEPGITKN